MYIKTGSKKATGEEKKWWQQLLRTSCSRKSDEDIDRFLASKRDIILCCLHFFPSDLMLKPSGSWTIKV